MQVFILKSGLSALVTVLAIVAAATGALIATPGNVAPAEASQTADAKIAGQVLRIKGTNDDDKLTFRLQAGNANVIEVDVGDDGSADYGFDLASFSEITINAKAGDDLVRVDEANGPIVRPTSILAGNGDDTVLGGSAIETIDGGPGDDLIDGNRGADIAFMGDGDDTFVWDPGDGSDVVEGGDGSDTLLFNGANGGETVDLSANGERFTFFRQPGNITMDVNEVETSVFNALNGQDIITVNDLTGTDVTRAEFDLNVALGGGDLLADQVTINGTPGNDAIAVTGSAGSIEVTGLSATVAITAAEAANDLLTINALGGDDTVDASALQADTLKTLTIDGGSGNDLILGGRGADSLIGGDGNDFVDGNQGADTGLLGAGGDVFRWDPGDGSDVVEGGEGHDALGFNGAGASETVDISANAGRLLFFRNPANITMDVNEVETVVFNAFAGTDTITVNDLTGTGVSAVLLNLAAAPFGSGVGDGEADSVIVNGTAVDDSIDVTGSAGFVNVLGLSADVQIFQAEATDRLEVNTDAGNDTVDTSGLAAGVIQLLVDGVPL